MDALCVFGRGIEKVRVCGEYAWRPTRLIEVLSENRFHTGYRAVGLDPEDEFSVIAGANANVLAAIQIFEELAKNNNPPRLVMFAAGRPKYLALDPDPTLSEGKILAEKFIRMVNIENTNFPEIITQSENKNSKDDLEQSLELATKNEVTNLSIITVSVHIPRVKELFRMCLNDKPLYKNLGISFLASEKILLRRYKSISLYKRMLSQLQGSKAYQRTVLNEQQGIIALRSGNYG